MDSSEEASASASPPPSSSKTPDEETNKKEEKTKGPKEIDDEQDIKMVLYIVRYWDEIRDKSLLEIRHLAKDMEGGKDIINKKDDYGMYPLHWACLGGASVDVIGYLVDNTEGGRDTLNKKDDDGMYPLHCACRGGASLDVIGYLVDNTEGGRDTLNKKDDRGKYLLHWACQGGASVDVIRFLIECAEEVTTLSDDNGSIPVDYLDYSKAAELFGESKTGAIADKASTIDKLGYSTYAKALAKAVRIAETPDSSLCVGLYGTWGSGKSTLWKHIVNHLEAGFQTDDAQCFLEKISSEENITAADKCFKKARAKVLASSIIGKNEKNSLGVQLGQGKENYIPFGKWCLSLFLQNLCCRPIDEAKSLDTESGKYNMHRRDERHALVFSVLVILSFLTVAPVLYAYYYYVRHIRNVKTPINIEDFKTPINIQDVDKVFDLIMGDAIVGKGGNGDHNLWNGFVIVLLWTVRLAVRGIKSIVKTMNSWFGCFRRDATDSAPPKGLPEYARVDFNAWAYSGSDHLWASLIRSLWNEVENKFTRRAVGLHRAKVNLARESPFRNPENDLSALDRKEKRDAAWMEYKIKFYAYAVLSIAAIALSVFIAPLIIQSIDGNKPTMSNNTFTKDNSGEDANNTNVIVTWLCASLASFPLLLQVVRFIIQILPYLTQSMGDKLSNKAKRKDFSMEEGFMGEVKREVEYLFDLLKTQTYMDKNIGCRRSLRLCVFVDDLDRCPEEMVVKILEAIILLLVDGPITCWLAIDNRVVVECIKAQKKGVYTAAEIHGQEFLDKIVQLPFYLPDLSTQHKKSFLSKIVEGNELKPSRVNSRISSYMDSKKARSEVGYDALKFHNSFIYQREQWENNVSFGDKEKAIISLLKHYHAMKELGHKMNNQDCHIFGMSESDLVDTIKKSIKGGSLSCVREGHIENFCLLMQREHRKWKTHAAETFLKRAVQKQEDTAPDTAPPSIENESKNNASSAGTSSMLPSLTIPEQTTAQKYQKMLMIAISKETVEYKMKEDGVDAKIIAFVLGQPSASNASPVRSSIIYLPSKYLKLPMFNKTERDALDDYCQFLNGNARKLKRIVNIFNVCRSIFNHRSGSLNSIRSNLSTSDILRFVILVEQWPCRMSWLLQFIDNMEQNKNFSLNTMVDLPTLENAKDMDAATFFTKVVDIPMHDNKHSTEMLLIDANPKLFLGLLRNKTALKVTDFLFSSDAGYEVLRDYAFNFPSYMKEKVERYLAKMDAKK